MKVDMNNLDSITPEFLKLMDSEGYRPAWITWSYLSMRGMAFSSDRKLYDYLERVEEVKEQMIKDGYSFYVDNNYM